MLWKEFKERIDNAIEKSRIKHGSLSGDVWLINILDSDSDKVTIDISTDRFNLHDVLFEKEESKDMKLSEFTTEELLEEAHARKDCTAVLFKDLTKKLDELGESKDE